MSLSRLAVPTPFVCAYNMILPCLKKNLHMTNIPQGYEKVFSGYYLLYFEENFLNRDVFVCLICKRIRKSKFYMVKRNR